MSINHVHRAQEHSKARGVLSELSHLRRVASDTQAMLSTLSLDSPEEIRLTSCVAGFVDGLAVQIEQKHYQSYPTDLFQYGYDLCRRQAIVGLATALKRLDARYALLKALVTGTAVRHSLPLFEQRLAKLKLRIEELSRTCRHKLNDLHLASSEYVALSETLTSFEEMCREAKSWGNPRHHLVGFLIALLVAIILIPLTPTILEAWTHVTAGFNPAMASAAVKTEAAQAVHAVLVRTTPLGYRNERPIPANSPSEQNSNRKTRH
jgi:hypothetical protein